MNTYSNRNTWGASDGERYTSSQVERKISQAKAQKLGEFRDEHGYYYCEDCKKSGGVRLDCSHDISVDQCKKTGEVEMAWDVNNITIRCRECHVLHDHGANENHTGQSVDEEEETGDVTSLETAIDFRDRMKKGIDWRGNYDFDWY